MTFIYDIIQEKTHIRRQKNRKLRNDETERRILGQKTRKGQTNKTGGKGKNKEENKISEEYKDNKINQRKLKKLNSTQVNEAMGKYD